MEAFAPCAGGELPLTDGGALEIERGEKAQTRGPVEPGHDGGLDDPELGEAVAAL